MDKEKELRTYKGKGESPLKSFRVPTPPPIIQRPITSVRGAGGPEGGVRGPLEKALRAASSLTASTQRLASSVYRLVASKTSTLRPQENESEEHESRSFYLSLVSTAKNQTRFLEMTSQYLKKILVEVSRIREILEEWYEKRNQLSLRDLLSGALGVLGSLFKAPQGAFRLARGLLVPLVSYLFGRTLPNLLRRNRPGGSGAGGVVLGGERGRGPRTGTPLRERISRFVQKTRERLSDISERTSKRFPLVSRLASRAYQPVRSFAESMKNNPTLARGAEAVKSVGRRAVSLGKEGLSLAGKAVGAGLRGLSRVVPVVALAGLGYDLIKNYQESRENFEKGLGGSLKSLGASAISTLSLGLIPPEVSSRFVKVISDALGGLAGSISEKLKDVFSRVSKSISDVYSYVKERVSRGFEAVRGWISSGIEFIRETLLSFKDSVSKAASEVSSWLFDRISSVRESINSGIEGLKELSSKVYESSLELVSRVSSWFSDKALSGINLAKDISSKIQDFVSGVVQNITSGISSFFEGVKTFFSDLGKRFVSDPIGTIRSVVLGFKDIINNLMTPSPSGGAKGDQPAALPPPAARKPDVGYIPVQSIAARPGEPGSLPTIGPSSDVVGVYQNLVRRSVGDYPVTQLIGQNKPYYDSRGRLVNPMGYGKYGHMGIDVATPVGTPVRAPFTGVVVDASGGAWGKSVYLIGKNVAVRFSHLSSIDVPSGSIVAAGQVIAKTGNTGNSTGPHLDITTYTARDGKVGSWISNYQVINRLVSAEVSGKTLSEKELKELQAKVRESYPKIQQVSTDSGQVPVSSPFGLALQSLAQSAATLLGLDPSRIEEVISAIKKRVSDFSGYLENLNRGRIVDIRESEKIIRKIIGTPERFQSAPMIKTIDREPPPLRTQEKKPTDKRPGARAPVPTKPPASKAPTKPASKPTAPAKQSPPKPASPKPPSPAPQAPTKPASPQTPTVTPKSPPTAPKPKPQEVKPSSVVSSPQGATSVVLPSPYQQENLSGYLEKTSPQPLALIGGQTISTGAPQPGPGSFEVVQEGVKTATQSPYSPQGAQVQSRPAPMVRIPPTIELKYTPTNPPQVNLTPPPSSTAPTAAVPGHIGTGAKTTSNEGIQELLLINTLLV